MWNKIAANGAGPQDSGPVPAQQPGAAEDYSQDEAQPGAASDSESSGGDIGQILSQRAKTLTPQEQQAFEQGITAPALQVLKKIIPEIGPAIDQLIQKKQGGGGMPGGDAGAPMPEAMPPADGAPPPPQQAKTGLSRF